ncbi:GNAT family N-acetyltransferase [Aquella oligotrophica]|uniref:N-acetyltransferase n=1 Tax=Aquella oligotrophica TaxID=2067065 RepID=A0A2I7N5F4_9NEIS|nr:GNAT family protein [Aquella oligotrophica]AUR51445.1 N-acetyltransferase [Aquella oligotrophica]
MSLLVKPVSLIGKYAKLLPLSIEYLEELIEAVKDGELWNLWFTSVPAPERMNAEIERRLDLQEKGEMLPFVIVDAITDKVIGMTTYCRIDPANKRLEIGFTWYRRSYQKTLVNTECKLMLLRHAFEALGCIAVEFRTSSFNFESQRAISRLGAKLDGILRSARLMEDGTTYDSHVYSIIKSEWTAVRTNLEYKLQKYSQV